MYITCPSCNTSFLIDEKQVGPSGRKVKCSSCSYLWLAMPDAIRQNNDSFVSIYEQHSSTDHTLDYAPSPGINLPVIVPNYTPLISQLIILCSLVSLILVGIIAVSNKTSWHHIYNGDISKLTPKILNANIGLKSQETKIRYSITNHTNYEIKSPLVRIQMLDSDNRIITEHITNKSDIVIYPNDSLFLETIIPNMPPDIQAVTLNLGDQLDFMVK